ncbi:MAG: acylphosphatase [Thermoplasmata archaeon]|nr:acylphosphatase [Thermoplasmata archaeon]
MNARAHVIFHGRVQGVFFRANTQRQAVELGLKGWVKNLPDRAVEAIIEGDKPKVEQLIEWCSHHQPMAKVTDAEVTWEDHTGEFNSFEVVYY